MDVNVDLCRVYALSGRKYYEIVSVVVTPLRRSQRLELALRAWPERQHSSVDVDEGVRFAELAQYLHV
jgi:hypothetical protein